MKAALRKAGNLSGMLAPLLWAGAIVYCGALRPAFSHYRQYISELGERASSTELIMRYTGFVPTGLLHIAFAAFLLVTFRGQRAATIGALLIALNGAARIAAGMFPCDLGCSLPQPSLDQRLHSWAATVGFLSLIAAAFVWGWLFRCNERLRCLSSYTLITACVATLFVVLTSVSDATRAGTGLYERLSSGALSLWLLVFAARLWWLGAYSGDTKAGSIKSH